MLAAMNEYWADHPPVHIMVAAYMGIGKKSTQSSGEPLESASEFVPVAAVPKAEFDAILAGFGLPTSPAQ
jgi:hypothetical protein